MRLTNHAASPRPRPVYFFLVSLVFFVVALLGAVAQGPASANPPAPAPVKASSQEAIDRLQEMIEKYPQSANAYAQLGLAYLQRLRETYDPVYYAKAELAFEEALKRDPDQLDARIGSAMMALSRHQFAQGLALSEQALRLNPYRVETRGAIVDALVELGRYDEAVAALQEMVDLRPGLSAYTRISYLRELYGETQAAIAAMQAAVEASPVGSEGWLWSQYQLGNLYFTSGDLENAAKIYSQELALQPDYMYAQAGLAQVTAARGETHAAIQAYRKIIERLPLPQFVISLGDLYRISGRADLARDEYDLVRLMEQLNASAGVDVDLEMGFFDADHGADPQAVVQRARGVYNRRPTIYAADLLAWALYRLGDYPSAQVYSQQALRLGTRDARLYYHAGMIALAQGRSADARLLLAESLEINPHFDLIQAPVARAALKRLGE